MYTIIVFIPKPQKFKLSMGVTVVSSPDGPRLRPRRRLGPDRAPGRPQFLQVRLRLLPGGPPAGGLGGAACPAAKLAPALAVSPSRPGVRVTVTRLNLNSRPAGPVSRFGYRASAYRSGGGQAGGGQEGNPGGPDSIPVFRPVP